MISLHFAGGTVAAAPTHLYPYVDGMSAFVLLSGLVLGIVYRRWIDRHGLRYAMGRLMRRIAVLYVCQLTISLIAVAVAQTVAPRRFRALAVLPPDVDLGTRLRWSATMSYLPSGGNILLLYLLLMASAVLILPLLARRLWPLVVGASVALFGATLLWPTGTRGTSWMTLESFPDGPPIQNWAAWQILFVPAVVIGWRWDEWRLPERIDRWLVGLLVVTMLAGLAVGDILALDLFRGHRVMMVDKVDLGVLRAVLSFLVVTCVYGVFRSVLRWMRRDVLRPLVMTGARSLDSYVLQAALLLAVPVLIVDRPWSPGVAVAVAVSVFIVCWVWAEARARFGIDKLHRQPLRLATAIRRRPMIIRERRTGGDGTTGQA